MGFNDNSKDTSQSSSQFGIEPPALSLPKGGGAIRGIGEKFAANPVTGTGSLTVPIATSPSRSGFGPELSLSYDSGAGNGPFGLGWNLSSPNITRKTDKGLPRYGEGGSVDEFLLSGAEDLVPQLERIDGRWQTPEPLIRRVHGQSYGITRYRPRIEGLFARIERWQNQNDATDVCWRTITRDNLTSWYGRTAESRIANPEHPERIFSWLLCESYDDKGNVMLYRYKAEDSAQVNAFAPHERNRTERSRSANRYLKRICYANTQPYFPELAEDTATPLPNEWLFEVVFDYGEHDESVPVPSEQSPWSVRPDPFSRYRAGFEVRTYRLCQRVLMFHHFPKEEEVGANCLVRSTDFTYRFETDNSSSLDPIYSQLDSVTQCGYRRQENGYLRKTLPPVEFDYSQPVLGSQLQTLFAKDAEHLPYGVDNQRYQWLDLNGEGLSGVLTEQNGIWFYSANRSPLTYQSAHHAMAGQTQDNTQAMFGTAQPVRTLPSGGLAARQFLDLAGDGQVDLVQLVTPLCGFYEREVELTSADSASAALNWHSFRPFVSQPNINWTDANTKLLDLTGDGLADVLITEERALVWHPSLGEAGFGEAQRVSVFEDEEQGPRLVFADGTETLLLADLSGDGLSDLVRIRNGDCCYWPNLGYGRFGAKVSMDNPPRFDNPEQFEPARVRLADIDGSGTTDILYLGHSQTSVWFNLSGNGWSAPQTIEQAPQVSDLTQVSVVDLLGNGTACLVWSSANPNDAQAPMQYLELMAQGKPHLMVATRNNLGAETHVRYAPSTYFYLKDQEAGTPWATRLPFPVHAVERVETLDRISRNRFVSRYTYHHGYFDGREREFRGFGRVDQYDTEEFAALSSDGELFISDNIHESSHVPPVLTKRWFHTGAWSDADNRHNTASFTAYRHEYYREPGLSDEQAKAQLLPDTQLPDGLTPAERREAVRALKGSLLRQEVYGLDGSDKQPHPYSVTEQSFSLILLQPQSNHQHGVFFVHQLEALDFNYEREPNDPRVSHSLTLEVDQFGNALQEIAVAYGRRNLDSNLSFEEQREQNRTHIIYSKNRFTNPVDESDVHRLPLIAETQSFELTHYTPSGPDGRFQAQDFVSVNSGSKALIFDRELNYESESNINQKRQRRLIEAMRTYYRADDLGVSIKNETGLLELGQLQSKALIGETYKLAFTPGLIQSVYRRKTGPKAEALLPNPENVMPIERAKNYGSNREDGNRGGYVDIDGNGHWWAPSGRVFYAPKHSSAPQELENAKTHFFLPLRLRDPFSNDSIIEYDKYDLLIKETVDALNNQITSRYNYRVLQASEIIDANDNRNQVVFDALGMVVGTAIMGKVDENKGDTLEDFVPDISEQQLQAHLQRPSESPEELIQSATSRLVYDLFAYMRNKNKNKYAPSVIYTLSRETHQSDLSTGEQVILQQKFSYSDGFGRTIQTKIQAEPDKNFQAQAGSRPSEKKETETGTNEATTQHGLRWVGSGWTIFNNKGQPIRQFEPFFSDTHQFEFDQKKGISPVLIYDAVGRLLATLHPNHSWEKVLSLPWHQISWDVNDTLLIDEPSQDPDVGSFFNRLPQHLYLPTWYQQRHSGALGKRQMRAAHDSSHHAATPALAYADSLARTFLMVEHNRHPETLGSENITSGNSTTALNSNVAAQPLTHDYFKTRVVFDVEGNQRQVFDALGRMAVSYDYDMLGNQIHIASMEGGEKWTLMDMAGNPLLAWDSRGHQFFASYDALRRPTESFLVDSDGKKSLVGHSIYGESVKDAKHDNLRGKVIKLMDQAGIVSTDKYDFKGNLLHNQRQLASNYKDTLDWSKPVNLEPNVYHSYTQYDALNRPTQVTAPDNTVIRPRYNAANLLESVSASSSESSQPVDFVTNIDYDAKGQRQSISYGNGVTQHFYYDPLTFRLERMVARTSFSKFVNDAVKRSVGKQKLQDLHYTYDPMGNITHIQDDAQQAVYFDNIRVSANRDFLYDALYRLINATGREHIGQNNHSARQHYNHDDALRIARPQPTDGRAMGRYLERYQYDSTGNILSLQHVSRTSKAANWIRHYYYQEVSQLQPDAVNNRLSSTSIGSSEQRYHYQGSAAMHGNITAMPHLSLMHWDYRDQLRATSSQHQMKKTDLQQSDSETTWYVYGSTGQRIRKVTENTNSRNRRIKERIYLSGFEIYREYDRNDDIKLERTTLHIMDDQQLIALVEKRIKGQDKSPAKLTRYQLADHLGSTSVELDRLARIISYEEYMPFGSTSYQAVRNQLETPKRYRFSGSERDEENGFNYQGSRYYASWLGRWINCDPIGIKDGLNLYRYVANNPVNLVDPTGTSGEVSAALGDLILYADKVKDRLLVGANVQKDHAISQKIIKTMLGPFAKLYKPGRDLTTVVETGAATGGAAARWHTVKSTAEKAIQSRISTLAKSGSSFSYADEVIGPVQQVLKQASNATLLSRQQYLAMLNQMSNMHVMTLEQTREMLKVIETGTPQQLEAAIDKLSKSRAGVAKYMKSLRDLAAAENATASALATASQSSTAVSTSSRIASGVRGVLGPVTKVLAPVARTLAPVGNFLGKIAGPAGVLLGVGQAVTADDTEGQIDGGITAVSSALLMHPHPVAKAAGGGLFAGQVIDKTLDVSDYSSSAGMFVNEGLKDLGANETASLVAGGIVTVMATPTAIGVAGAHKTYKGAKWAIGKVGGGLKSAWNYVF